MKMQASHIVSEHCTRVRTALLNLHRVLIDIERRDYEKVHGRQSAGDFLQVMAYDESMQWLEPLSRLIVMLDEALDEKSTIDVAPHVVAARALELLKLDRERTDSFASRYLHHFDRSADLAVEHAALVQLLNTVV
ncbi:MULTISPECIES: hypothetical protein [Ralstonia]|uniref:hypothetical protein n=1 Tax=Ralstonia TaxID=48736 RepID=UPI00038640A3|nr:MULTISPECIES: hypothetical protein [Ralstonia]EPX97684.1 hypothetical protein C404_11575 [Ralstonia sp. AU12-08]GAQ31104.1 hypothetical protein SAMD00023378_4787 [Ralstonia sp. NT80]